MNRRHWLKRLFGLGAAGAAATVSRVQATGCVEGHEDLLGVLEADARAGEQLVVLITSENLKGFYVCAGIAGVAMQEGDEVVLRGLVWYPRYSYRGVPLRYKQDLER